MLIGFLLCFIGFYYMNQVDSTEGSVNLLLFISLIYIAEILNDYFHWWYSPMQLPESKRSFRFLFIESLFILLPVSMHLITLGMETSLLTFHSIISICILGLGFKYFALELGRFVVKYFSDKSQVNIH